MRKLAVEFKQFLLQASLITLATAVIMGAVTTALIKALVVDLMTPLVALIFGQPHFQNLSFTLNHSHFQYGDLINVALTFVLTGVAVFFFIIKPYEHFRKDDDSTQACPDCTSAIPTAAKRCPFCTAQIAPEPRAQPRKRKGGVPQTPP